MQDIRNSITVRVWELPVRLFHWLLAAAFLVAWLTRDDRYLHVHVFAGYVIAGLLVFRIIWGFTGGPYARFRNFAFRFRDIGNYVSQLLTGKAVRFLGHNPAGGLAVFALLIASAMVVITGLVTLGGEERHGLLAGWLSFEQGEAGHYAHEFLAWTLLALVGIHLLGVAVESVLHRENLPRSMITGWKFTSRFKPSAPSHSLVGFALLITLAAGLVLYFRGALLATPDAPYLPFEGPVLADNAKWRDECGSCHLAYHPSLLPARSWRALMQDQSAHFDEDLSLNTQTVNTVMDFLVANASETRPTEAAWKIGRSIAQGETPLRITETGYWKQKHDFPDRIWQSGQVKGRHDCAACHLDADRGTFEDGAMRLPAPDTIFARR